MADLFPDALRILAWPATRLLNPGDSWSLFSLFGFLLLASSIPAVRSRGTLRAVFARRVLRHPSTVLDAKVYVVNSVLYAAVLASWIIGSDVWSGWTQTLIGPGSGAAPSMNVPAWVAELAATVATFAALEFGYYAAHALAHRSKTLWRFHKQHHSAEVLTPLTGLREHPVDTLLFGNVISLCVGVAHGVVAHMTGAGPWLLWQTNVLLLGYFITLQHMRHTHVWLPFTGALGYVLQSPAHHQLHHAADPAAQGRNLGFGLSIFDALFGTLLLPRMAAPEHYGLPEEDRASSLREFFFAPFERPAPEDKVSALPPQSAAAASKI